MTAPAPPAPPVVERVLCNGLIVTADGARRRCGVWLDPVLAAAGYTTHPCCDPDGTELYCLACQRGPAACRCAEPRLWRPGPAALAVTGPPAAPPARKQPANAPAAQVAAAAPAPEPGLTAPERCGGCAHAFHRDACTRKGPTSCVDVLDPATGLKTGIACGARPPCPCPHGACHDCGAPVVGASTLPLDSGDPEIDIDRGSAGDPDGTWAVWKLTDGTLACRPLDPGARSREGEWRGRAHTASCPSRVKEPA